MDDLNKENLLNLGDENKTILLDETDEKSNESIIENERNVNEESKESPSELDSTELIKNTKIKTNSDDLAIEDQVKDIDKTDISKSDDKNSDDNADQLKIAHINPDELTEDDVEETVLERLIGLTEMFPDSLRDLGYSIITSTFPFIKRTYNLTRNISWIFFSSFAILVVPVSLEKERCQTQRDLDRQMLLGGGKTTGGLGMAPAPISK